MSTITKKKKLVNKRTGRTLTLTRTKHLNGPSTNTHRGRRVNRRRLS